MALCLESALVIRRTTDDEIPFRGIPTESDACLQLVESGVSHHGEGIASGPFPQHFKIQLHGSSFYLQFESDITNDYITNDLDASWSLHAFEHNRRLLTV